MIKIIAVKRIRLTALFSFPNH